MNEAQESHVKAMAHKIELQAELIALRMKALQRNSLVSMPVDFIAINFQDVTYYADEMKSVVTEMLPTMPKE